MATNEIDIAIISEPNKNLAKRDSWYTDINLDASIYIKGKNKRTAITSWGQGNGFVWIDCLETSIYSCYVSPNISIDEFNQFLNELKNDIITRKNNCLVCGDFNAKSMMWNSAVNDRRGDTLSEWASELNLVTLNSGITPTFCRGQSASIIDVSFASTKIAALVTNWRVSVEENLTDHNYIFFEINDMKRQALMEAYEPRGWKVDTSKMDIFVDRLRNKVTKEQTVTAEKFMETIRQVCDKTFRRKGNIKGRRKPVYWWSADIANIRRECLSWKRKMTRLHKRADISQDQKSAAQNLYKEKRTCLKKAIMRAKLSAWKKVIEEVEEDPWGLGYRIAMRKLNFRASPALSEELMMVEAEKLFPRHEVTKWSDTEIREDIPPFTAEELDKASKCIKLKKAAGPDGVPPEVVKCVAQSFSTECLRVMNQPIMKGEFPVIWKTARLLLIEKPRKQEQVKPAYRPLCLINCMGKLLEHLIKDRIVEEIRRTGGLADTQFGFTKKKSTIDAMLKVMEEVNKAKTPAPQNRKLCLLLTLDVKNAFNSAPWQGIVKEMEKRKIAAYLIRMMKSYFSDRSILIGDNNTMKVTSGVPQGSVLGPILWNIYYDDVLRLDMPPGVLLIGFADDLAVVVSGKTEIEITTTANIAVHRIGEWMASRRLELAPEKTEATLLVGRRAVRQVIIDIKDARVTTKPETKYLGVFFDQGAKMKSHITNTSRRAETTVAALSRLMPNREGPSSSKRRLLSAVTHSIMLYAAPIWHETLKYQKYKHMFLKIQRKLAIRICSAFRTVSTEALLVLAGIVPIDLLGHERSITYGKEHAARKAERINTLNEWQRRWETTYDVGLWTKRLIPDLRIWYKRDHGELTYALTQLLCGHGCFAAYFYRFKLNISPTCRYCVGEQDDADHTFFVCPRWQDERRRAETEANERITPENVVSVMLKSEKMWHTISTMALNIITQKEKDERRRPADND